MSRAIKLEPTSELVLKQTASIMGPQSAAARALRERDARRAAGEPVDIFFDRGLYMLLIGPKPETRP